MKFSKLISSLIRRFSDAIALKTDLYLSHKPDFHTKLKKIDDFENLYRLWVQNSPRNDKGDLVRLYFLLSQIEYIKKNNIPGFIAELGVYKGTTARLFHETLPNREILLFDTFEGFDSRDIDHEKENSKAKEAGWEVSITQVKKYIGTSELIHLFQGYFPDTTKDVDPNNCYALVHLDADLYQPQKSGLEYFYPRMSLGGIIIIHDYNNEYHGSKKAVDEFFLDKTEQPITIPDKSGSAVIIKL